VNNEFINQFSENIKFSYTCFDRVIIKGYLLGLYSEKNLRNLLKALGFKDCSKAVLRLFTDQLDSHIKKAAAQHNVPILWWPSVDGGKNGAKLAYVEKHFVRKYKGNGNFTYCVITNKEPVMTFSSRKLMSKKGKPYNQMYKVKKPVKQYYIYFHDKVLGGPCYLKISSYFPFYAEFYFNGHNAIRLALDKKGISYRMHENSFVDIADCALPQQVTGELQGQLVQQRIQYWMDRFFRFDKGKYSTRSKYLEHDWFSGQVEVCTNVIFKSSRYCSNLFARVLDKFQRLGLPDRVSQIFDMRPRRLNSKRTWRLFNNNACVKNWFRGNSIKQYNKNGYLLRTETTINNPKSLGPKKLKKPVIYLQAYLWFGLGCNNRFLNCCADVDASSISENEPDLHSQPVIDENGRRTAAIDPRNKRQTALLRELLKPKYSVYGFKTRDLLPAMSEFFSNPAKIRYELKKLIVRRVVQKLKNHSFYIVTKQGLKWLWVAISSISNFANPIISKCYKKEFLSACEQASKIEQAYALINQGLSQLTQQLCIAA